MYKSKEQIAEENRIARNVSIMYVAQSIGFNLKRVGGGACQYRDDYNHINIYPETNSYYNYYENRGGSPIDMLVNEDNMTLMEAINWLVDNSNEVLHTDLIENTRNIQNESYKKTEEKENSMTLPPKNGNHHRVFSYLTKTRRIDAAVVQKFLHLHTLYESADHHNCIFVGMDKDGNAKHGFVRGTLTDKVFKGDVPGSDKTYGFSYINEESNVLMVFEAPIDLMSYITLFPDQDVNMVALGMLCTDPVDTLLKDYPNINEIIFTLDVDQYGKDAMEEQVGLYNERGYKSYINSFCKEISQVGAKDVNEYLIKMRNIEEQLMSGRSENTPGKKI